MANETFGGSAEEAGWHQRHGSNLRISVGDKVIWENDKVLAAMTCAECGKNGLDCHCGRQAFQRDIMPQAEQARMEAI